MKICGPYQGFGGAGEICHSFSWSLETLENTLGEMGSRPQNLSGFYGVGRKDLRKKDGNFCFKVQGANPW